MEVTDPSHFGAMTFAELESVGLAPAGSAGHTVTVSRQRGEWRPPERLAEFFSDGFTIPVDCYTGPDGLRRLVPRYSFEELIDLGAVGGLAVIRGMRGSDPEVGCSYRAMHLIHQHVRGRVYRGTRGMREHMTRNFECSRDLFVRRPGRVSDDERDVLPNDVGLDFDGDGHRLSVMQLTELGRQAAREAGHPQPTNKQAVQFGLYEAAKRCPLSVEIGRVPNLVRMALFNIDSTYDAPSEELIEIVTERLLEAIQRHLDDFQEDFDGWFSGPRNSLVKQIAQQKGKRGGKLPTEEVRQALLHLGWQAYQYVGQCVHALMRTIKNSVPAPLTDEECEVFERMHESRPCYGDLPLALLAERADFLQRAILAIWNAPNNCENVGVLHRMLAYYADMGRKRLQADRQFKRRSQVGSFASFQDAGTSGHAKKENADGGAQNLSDVDGRHTESGRYAGSVQFIENLHSQHSNEKGPFARVSDYLRELRGVACAAACENWDYQLRSESQNSVAIDMTCECGRVVRTIEITRDEFVARAEEVLQWTKSAPAEISADVAGASGES